MRFYNDMEKVIRNNGERGLEQLEHYYGVLLEVFRANPQNDVYARVHGKNRGRQGNMIAKVIGILVGDDFFPSDDEFSGGFELGFLYTRSGKIKVGDVLRIAPEDGKERKYKVESKEDIGLTDSVFEKYKLSNIGD
jgi:hypothetical protein